MKKNLTELVFILDRSGSMAGLEKDTIGGFNSMIARQKAAEGDALVSTVLFSNESKVIHDRIDVRRVKSLTDRQYVACGCTALLDAIGGAIHHIGNVHKYAREEDRPEHTLFVITTDGMENAFSSAGTEDTLLASENSFRHSASSASTSSLRRLFSLIRAENRRIISSDLSFRSL